MLLQQVDLKTTLNSFFFKGSLFNILNSTNPSDNPPVLHQVFNPLITDAIINDLKISFFNY